MRTYPGTTVDYEFAELGTLGYTGNLNDRQFAALRAEGLTGALPDMFKQFDGTLGGGAPDYVAEVEALLSGTTGWATDPADTAINFTDTAGTVPVATPGVDTIARINSKFGTTTYNWQQASVAGQYLWNGASMQADGVDDLISTSNATFLQNVTGASFTFRFLIDDLSTNRAVMSLSTITGTVARLQLIITSAGAISVGLRRLDADGGETHATAGGVITTGVAVTVQVTINYLNGAVAIFKDGVSVYTGTYAGTDGINGTSNTASTRNRWGLNTSNTLNDWFDGKMGAAVFAPSVLSAGDLANCRGFVERNAL